MLFGKHATALNSAEEFMSGSAVNPIRPERKHTHTPQTTVLTSHPLTPETHEGRMVTAPIPCPWSSWPS